MKLNRAPKSKTFIYGTSPISGGFWNKGKFVFEIPSYQRGYRWEAKQVEDLLDDIFDFVTKKENVDSYFLQPIVVKKKDSGEGEVWSVLDGQQRITTLLLIMEQLIKYLSRADCEEYKELFTIKFQSRREINFENPDKCADINSYYVGSAKETIENWIETKKEERKKSLIDGECFENMAKSLFYTCHRKLVKFIWYDVSEEGNESDEDERKSDLDSIELFNRLNRGKIKLTESELIKALFILNMKDKNKEKMFAVSWDLMEKKFQEDSFWYYLSNESEKETRIDLLFDIIKGKTSKSEEDHSYRAYQKDFDAAEREFSELWDEVNETYNKLIQYYEDITLYNYVGYLTKIGKPVFEIISFIKIEERKQAEKWDRKELIRALQAMISKELNLTEEKIFDLRYDEEPSKIKNILLLFNIETYVRAKIKFPFAEYCQCHWDIEHVDSQTKDSLSSKEDILQWIKYVIGALKMMPQTEERDTLLLNANEIDKKEMISISEFSDFRQKISAFFGEDTNEEGIHMINNLTLLDCHTNRSYKNAPFPYKQYCILKKDEKGEFIPLCTKNLFLKYYSNVSDVATVLNPIRWNDEDKKMYGQAIVNTLHRYFKENA